LHCTQYRKPGARGAIALTGVTCNTIQSCGMLPNMLALPIAILVLLAALPAGAVAAPRIVQVLPPDLEAVVDSVSTADGELCDVMFKLAPGTYHLRPEPYTDPTCGNCQQAATPVPATLGLRVTAETS
jgi:hypothetical protein